MSRHSRLDLQPIERLGIRYGWIPAPDHLHPRQPCHGRATVAGPSARVMASARQALHDDFASATTTVMAEYHRGLTTWLMG